MPTNSTTLTKDVHQLRPVAVSRGPKAPSPDQLAAIVVAVEALWPRPARDDDIKQAAETVWRFANRWWSGNNVLLRTRPRRRGVFQ